MNQNHEPYFKEAVEMAGRSMCKRGRIGAVVVLGEEVIGRGYNAPPNDSEENRMCHTDYRISDAKPKTDRTCCVHAEWRAIIDAIKNKKDISSSSIYVAGVDTDGTVIKSSKPYCTVCSRLALDTGIKYFVLRHEDGIRAYDTKEYNKLSYDFHKSMVS